MLNQSHLPWLDGLRGVAAVWVLLSHVQILSGMRYLPILSWGGLAVDLFMMLSGFLMAHHYILRKSQEPWHSKKTVAIFWIRRYFRIAPLFYTLLTVAFILGSWMGECRSLIASIWPSTATPMERYTDNSLSNFIAHISFVFGAFPDWAFRSPLPDWSLGLEMQFYLFFPLIMYVMSVWGAIKTSLVIVFMCLSFRYLYPDFYHSFQMPSFLLIKLYVFLLGIWIAFARWQGEMTRGFIVAIGVAIIWLVLEQSQIAFARLILIVLLFYLMDNGTMPASTLLVKVIWPVRLLLSSRLSVFLGETSYACYLFHLIVVIPVASLLVEYPDYLAAHETVRFIICLFISLPLIYLASWLLFISIETMGIKVGKKIVNLISK